MYQIDYVYMHCSHGNSTDFVEGGGIVGGSGYKGVISLSLVYKHDRAVRSRRGNAPNNIVK
jgi:hypothetical protein